ncbi:MAG: hypothetical protein A3J07_04425 [Candidatus Doudnabacteria bacterium RIFCSPLOWO2_02_FULL_49_13]|uniref:Prepilin-type N-terminal cleavage/methylation domain-containing protein n=1 Tax=Candidatus Doudnabacteria bacterium RIFCSPHIGHO2_12_FULL_48_16 TaxID=1817838 RepID=A0A1F5PJQ3_9BACT|nr:MAG: hypothetical protein A3B77_03140 [Candidatus Doudnabacteria bacterium RIFCSPHIGHO2_02_FULL_49_24]OGE89114.1 MAG: hypothetical protein A2760_04075 [Candidatus Doudnabacteria bacterium RIFCSPHIGHO2_01_FULL_50_67]OGE90156.1 MAG: hypothetical protein A3E29_03565 [Candidatus Doudnabacteria bacterium RIFCSPHIGHO2_12_FULL_48_16]OGE97221.1 MAG: hypothetical protein A2990_01340 [Candidatus Doudnabacteria bacterium RIFCSPLOWO2_01_FULL_49_40]OGF03298.1 MAG: hypothetical protein A3J07_04425 [Candid
MSNYKLQITKRGFTLIETIIVIALVAVAGVILSDLFIGQNRLYRSETAELNVTADARAALDDVDNYLRQANRAVASHSTYSAGPQILILQIQSVDGSGRLVAGTFDYAVYYLSASDLWRQVFPDAASSRPAAAKKLANHINGLVFTYNNPDYSLVTEVQTDLTIQESAGAQTRSITASSKAKLRNY